jgi:hypothetical protein
MPEWEASEYMDKSGLRGIPWQPVLPKYRQIRQAGGPPDAALRPTGKPLFGR